MIVFGGKKYEIKFWMYQPGYGLNLGQTNQLWIESFKVDRGGGVNPAS